MVSCQREGTIRRQAGASALGAVLLLSCATANTFTRPVTQAVPTITNELTAQTYTDCAKAIAETTTDTVLTFSEGVFQCGPTVPTVAGWLVVRGAGMGKTFLQAAPPTEAEPDAPPQLTALRPAVGSYLRVQDVTFGGLSGVPGDGTHVELVRVAAFTKRPALIGSPDKVEGSVLVVHSLMVGTLVTPTDRLPKPLAIAGNEHIAVVESVLKDVEQEFDRYPAPGSIVLLSKGVQDAFSRHEPASKGRRDPSLRPNAVCGAPRNPMVLCASEGQQLKGQGPIVDAAKRFQEGQPVGAIEQPLRAAGKDFGERFATGLGSGIRQPDVFWFEEGDAKALEDESQSSGKGALSALVRVRIDDIVKQCNQTNTAMRQSLEKAALVDRLLPAPLAVNSCREALSRRMESLVQDCKTSWDWERVLGGIGNADQALGANGATVMTCRNLMAARLPPPASRGSLADAYLREVAASLKLNSPLGGTGTPPNLEAVDASLPWIVTRSDRTITQSTPPNVLDHILYANQKPGAGDGRQLVELTPPCAMVPGGVPKAGGVVRLGLRAAHAGPTDEARIVMEIPVETSADEIPTAGGAQKIAIVKRCEEKAALVYNDAVRQFVQQELERVATTAEDPARIDAEVALQIVRTELKAPQTVRPKNFRAPVVVGALAKVAAVIRRLPLDIAVVGVGAVRPDVRAVAALAEGIVRPPPDWSPTDFALAADSLARATAADVDACQVQVPDVPWQAVDGGAAQRGAVVFDGQPALVHCKPTPAGFEVSISAEGDKVRAKVHAAIKKVLTAKLGVPAVQKPAEGGGFVWKGLPTARSGFVLKASTVKGPVLGQVLVPVGSKWNK